MDLSTLAHDWGPLVAALLGLAGGLGVALKVAIPKITDAIIAERKTQKQAIVTANIVRQQAESNQDATIIRHEMDAETTAQNNLISVQNRFIDIYDRMQEHFFKQDERHIENTVAVQDAINAVRMAILRLESTVSLLTQTVSRQADAYASLECVKAKQKVDEEARQR